MKDNYIYVYKEYCDEDAYGEEIVKVFRSGVNAVEYLKQQFDKQYERFGETFTDVARAINSGGFDEDDIFDVREDTAHISIRNADGSTSFWIVEKKEIH